MSEESITDGILEKIRSSASKAGEGELLKTLTSRLHLRLTSSDAAVRQSSLENIWRVNHADIVMMIGLMESGRDAALNTNLAAILREVICLKPSRGKPAKVQRKAMLKKHSLDSADHQDKKDQAPPKKVNNASRQVAINHTVQQNSTTTLMRILLQVQARKEPNSELLLCDLLWILSQLSQKDGKFSIKARMLGAVKVVHALLKSNMNNNKILFPLLNLMKQLSKHPITTAMLIRDGAVSTYEKVLISLGFVPTPRMRLCLDTINYFSRNKTCCIQLVKSGVVHILLRIFDRWDKMEGKMRIKICNHVLQTLQHLCTIKSGRNTIALKKHIQILHRFCTGCPQDEVFDRLLGKVCSIICICVSNKALPVPSSSPAVFSLSNVFNGSSASFKDQYDSNNEDDDSHSEDENEDVLSKESEGGSDSDAFNDKSVDEQFKSSGNTNFIVQSSLREVDDLKRYNPFFKEFYRLQKQLRLVRSASRGFSVDEFDSNMSSSNASLNAVQNMNLLQGFLINSTPSLIFNPESEMFANAKSNCKINKTKIKLRGEVVCTLKSIRDNVSSTANAHDMYLSVASSVKSVIPFVKVAYPNLHGSEAFCEPEYLNQVEPSTYRKKILLCVERAINPDTYTNEVVYDLDYLCNESNSKMQERVLGNSDVQKLSCKQYQHKKLEFESRFESGNLRKAIQIGPREYDLILTPDVNSSKRHLWFYFEVSGMASGFSYVFNIVNCEKSDSQFNFGMKPVMYSVKEATLGRPGWIRAGTDICYYRNQYQCMKNKTPSKSYLTVTFTIDFPHSDDVCYIAYHFPYTYSQMMTKIWKLSRNLPPNIYVRAEPLCHSLNGNEIPLLTITAVETINNPIQDREIIFLTSRVHPGESNASWVMEGTLRCLMDDSPLANLLRMSYVFKIVPMLNIEGVINGCYRCGLTNEDLNRRWSKPSPILHPDIYHTKGLVEYAALALKKPATVYCDFHGHSRKKNVFLYGCSPTQTWCPQDAQMPASLHYLRLPVAMQRCCPAFSSSSCSFRVERERESTARVSLWRQLGIRQSYTLEASFCGFDQGPYKGLQLNTRHLKDIGRDLCAALATLKEASPADLFSLATDENGRNKRADSDTSFSDSLDSDASDMEEDAD